LIGVFLRDVAPQLPVYYAIAAGERGAKHELRLIGDGSEALFAGEIGFGATSEIEALLDAHPEVTLLHLSSHGGRVMEARRLHDAIRRRGLTTFSATLCASACTIAFMGGKERVVTAEARIGFHQSMIVGGAPVEQAMMKSSDVRLLLDDGVERAFVERAYATPNSEVWYPDAEEMLRAHFVTRVLRSAAAAAAAPAAGAAGHDAAQRLGFFGRWAVDCRAPAAPANPVLALTRDGDGAHYHSSWGGQPPDFDTRIPELRQSGEHELSYSFTVRSATQHVVVTLSPGRMRTLQSWNDAGQAAIKDGVITGNGKETPFFQRCD
jgi:ATP-dependent protease ClpP protease subunit